MDIFGASGHGKVVLDAAVLSDKCVNQIWDDNPSLLEFAGYKIAGTFLQLKDAAVDELVLAIGNNQVRRKLALDIKANFCKIIHPASIISKSASIGAGTVVFANVVANADVSVGNHVILNTSCTVDHDCSLADFVHISPNAALAGNVHVGEGAHIGIGAVVIQGVKIGKWATIGAGAVIIRDVPDYAVVVGNPGRIIKYNRF